MEIFMNYVLPALAWVLVTGIPSVLTIYLNVKKAKAAKAEVEAAKTEQERAEAEARAESAKNAIVAETKRLVAEAEATYKEIDAMMKRANPNSSAGGLKKGYVVNALKAFCLENGFAWNATEMDDAIEAEVKYTKTVNAKTA